MARLLVILFGLLNGPCGLTQFAMAQADAAQPGATVVRPEFEVASIKPDRSAGGLTGIRFSPGGSLTASNVTLRFLIRMAYRVEDDEILGAPGWLSSEKYDVEAKPQESVANELQKLNPDQRGLEYQGMLQGLLEDRFKLTVHHETKELPVFALVIAKNGPKLQESKPGDAYSNGLKGASGALGAGGMRMGRGQLTGQGVALDLLVHTLSQQLGRTVVDKTGLAGRYDFTLQWTPDEGSAPMLQGAQGDPQGTTPAPDSSGPSIFTAIQEQLGLKLDSQKGLAEVLIIDHVEQPSEN